MVPLLVIYLKVLVVPRVAFDLIQVSRPWKLSVVEWINVHGKSLSRLAQLDKRHCFSDIAVSPDRMTSVRV